MIYKNRVFFYFDKETIEVKEEGLFLNVANRFIEKEGITGITLHRKQIRKKANNVSVGTRIGPVYMRKSFNLNEGYDTLYTLTFYYNHEFMIFTTFEQGTGIGAECFLKNWKDGTLTVQQAIENNKQRERDINDPRKNPLGYFLLFMSILGWVYFIYKMFIE